ncbi:hypothetical protein U6W38_12185, partial [Cutibacterium acnes]
PLFTLQNVSLAARLRASRRAVLVKMKYVRRFKDFRKFFAVLSSTAISIAKLVWSAPHMVALSVLRAAGEIRTAVSQIPAEQLTT